MSDDLVDRVRSAIQQRRAQAQAASPGFWQEINDSDEYPDWSVWAIRDEGGSDEVTGSGMPEADAVHIAANDPAAVIALCDAMATILKGHGQRYGGGIGYLDGAGYGAIDPCCNTCGIADEYAVAWPCNTFRTVAAAFGVEVEGCGDD